MSGQTMTVHQISELCEIDETTVCRWVKKASCKMPELACKLQEATIEKKSAHFHLNEILAIINAGGKHTMAALLAENAKAQEVPVKATRLPAGIQLRELRLLAEKRLISAEDVRSLLGLGRTLGVLPATETAASPEVAQKAFSEILGRLAAQPGLPPGTVERVARAAAGAAHGTLRTIEAKALADSKQPALIG